MLSSHLENGNKGSHLNFLLFSGLQKMLHRRARLLALPSQILDMADVDTSDVHYSFLNNNLNDTQKPSNSEVVI